MTHDVSKIRLERGDLAIVNRNADWRGIFRSLIADARSSGKGNEDDWWASSPFSEDSDPSFHINDKGWYCWSTGKSGDFIKLVQELKSLNAYQAAAWLLAEGLSSTTGVVSSGASSTPTARTKPAVTRRQTR